MEEWKDGRTEKWEILPHRHREHIEEGTEEWMEDFTTEAQRALRNTKKREWENRIKIVAYPHTIH